MERLMPCPAPRAPQSFDRRDLMRYTKRLVAALLVVLVTAVPVYAAIKLVAANPGNHTTGFTGTVLLPLNASGATTLTFSSSGVNAITYSAECAVDGDPFAYMSIEIIVDGVALPPTAGVNDAFCSGNETPGFDGWATQSVTVGTGKLPLGTHTVRVEATMVVGGAGWIADSSLVVKK
jgi:hypothetical protein